MTKRNQGGPKQSTEGVPVIRMYDPAVVGNSIADLDANERWNEYVLTRDKNIIPELLIPGERPTVFHVLKATRTGVRFIRGGANQGDRNERAFAICVSKVTEMRRNDRRVDFEHQDCDGATAMSEGALEKFDETDIQEIGAVALQLSFLARDLPVRCLPPATSWDAVRALTSLRVAPTSEPTMSDSPPSNGSPPEATGPTPLSSQHSAEPTGAIAAET